MYPVQQSFYPNQAQCVNPYLQPQVNAVKIDINNPTQRKKLIPLLQTEGKNSII